MKDVTFTWYDNEQKILMVHIELDDWTWEDAMIIIEEKVRWMHTVHHEVHTIYQFNHPPRIPKNNMFQHIKELMDIRSDNEGFTIFVGTSRLFEGFVNTAATIGRLHWLTEKYRYVSTLEQALDIIKTDDAS